MIQGQNVVHTSNPFHLSGYFELFCKNAFFYDSVVGLLTAVILLLAEFLPLREIDGQPRSAATSCPCLSWCRTCWSPPAARGKAASRSWRRPSSSGFGRSRRQKKARPPHRGRAGQKDERHDRQEKQAGQPLAIIPDNMKKQDGPPATPDRR